MGRFRFRLERVERLRLLDVDGAKATLAAAVLQRRQAEARREEARERLRRALARSQAEGAAGLPVWEAGLHAAFVNALAEGARAAEVELEQALAREEEARRAFLERRREARVLAALRERSFRRWRAEEDRRERRHLDEVAAARAARAVSGWL